LLVDSLHEPLANQIRGRIDERMGYVLVQYVYEINETCLLEYDDTLAMRAIDELSRDPLDEASKAVTKRYDDFADTLASRAGLRAADQTQVTGGCMLAELAMDADRREVDRLVGPHHTIRDEGSRAVEAATWDQLRKRIVDRDRALYQALRVMRRYTIMPPGTKPAFDEWYAVRQFLQQADDGAISIDHQNLQRLRGLVDIFATAVYTRGAEEQRSDTSWWALTVVSIRILMAYCVAVAARGLYNWRKKPQEPELRPTRPRT
jgi:hypothetical protein